jgi:predicted lipoprotein with Yx(FWY)xxD motif
MIKSKRLPFYVAGGAGLSALAAALGFTLSSTGSSASALSDSPSSTVVQTRDTSLGTILVDGQGRTLYLFAQDTGSASTCTGDCSSDWPPVPVSGTPTATGGASTAALGVTAGANGIRQLTYSGHPLYYFVADAKAGQTRGQAIDEFGAKWYVLDSTGAAVVRTSGTGSNTGSSTAGSQPNSGYGY